MASQLNPYLNFDGNAREAVEFYRSVLGGELTINTYGESGVPDPATADRVMHAQLETPKGYTLMVADLPPGLPHTPGNTITCSLSGDPGEGLEQAWEKLSEGGQVHVPFEKQMWGDVFGQCVDKFGVPWMVNVVAPR
jgi:PhnB protein